jgi:hypothetical protein
VRLVDRDQGRTQRLHLGQPLRRGQLLRRDEQEPGLAGADRLQRGPLLARRLGRADPDRAEPLLGQAGPLVVLEREQRRDHQRGAGQQGRRDLVDRRLASTGGEDDQGVAPLQDGAHGVELTGA